MTDEKLKSRPTDGTVGEVWVSPFANVTRVWANEIAYWGDMGDDCDRRTMAPIRIPVKGAPRPSESVNGAGALDANVTPGALERAREAAGLWMGASGPDWRVIGQNRKMLVALLDWAESVEQRLDAPCGADEDSK